MVVKRKFNMDERKEQQPPPKRAKRLDWKDAGVLTAIETIVLHDLFSWSSFLLTPLSELSRVKGRDIVLDDDDDVTILDFQGTEVVVSGADPRNLLARCDLYKTRLPSLKTIVLVTTRPIPDSKAGDVIIGQVCIDKKNVEHELKIDPRLLSGLDDVVSRADTVRRAIEPWTNSAVANLIAGYVNGSDLETLYQTVSSRLTPNAQQMISRTSGFQFRLRQARVVSTQNEFEVLNLVHQITNVNVAVIVGAEGESAQVAGMCAGITAVRLIGGPV